MKLSNKKRNNKIIIISVAVVILLLIGVVVGVILIKNSLKNTQDPYIMISSPATQLTYYIGDEFKSDGLKVQYIGATNEETYFVDDSQLQFSGFDSSVVNEAVVITVSYKGYTTSYTVAVTEKPAPDQEEKVIQSIAISNNFVTTYTASDWAWGFMDLGGVELTVTYSDGSTEVVPMLKRYFTNLKFDTREPGNYDLIIAYPDELNGVTTTITITITN